MTNSAKSESLSGSSFDMALSRITLKNARLLFQRSPSQAFGSVVRQSLEVQGVEIGYIGVAAPQIESLLSLQLQTQPLLIGAAQETTHDSGCCNEGSVPLVRCCHT
jgi:hypothetical protein